jgi:tetratricopeptide (TPR) repeat protein
VRGLENAIQLVQTHRPLSRPALVFALLLCALAACAPQPGRRQPPPHPSTMPRPTPLPQPGDPATAPSRPFGMQEDGDYPRSPEGVSGPAVLKLLDQARADVAAGRTDQAIAALETALNIEPRNPFVWQQLASTHLAQHLPEQAENKARRSNSFARGNPFIEAENWRLIAAARQERGDLTGARAARERMAELQELQDD